MISSPANCPAEVTFVNEISTACQILSPSATAIMPNVNEDVYKRQDNGYSVNNNIFYQFAIKYANTEITGGIHSWNRLKFLTGISHL